MKRAWSSGRPPTQGLKPSFSSKSCGPAEAGPFQSVLSNVANYGYMPLVLLCGRLGEHAARVQCQCLLERLLSAGLIALFAQRDRQPDVSLIEIRIELRRFAEALHCLVDVTPKHVRRHEELATEAGEDASAIGIELLRALVFRLHLGAVLRSSEHADAESNLASVKISEQAVRVGGLLVQLQGLLHARHGLVERVLRLLLVVVHAVSTAPVRFDARQFIKIHGIFWVLLPECAEVLLRTR